MVHEQVEVYAFCALPLEHPERESFTVRAEWRPRPSWRRPEDRWVVTSRGRTLSTGERWDYESWERSDAWMTDHRFSQADAIARARRLAATVTVEGWSATQVLARSAYL